MKKLIKEIFRKKIIELKLIKENIESVDDFLEFYNEEVRDILYMIKNGKQVRFNLIPKDQYHYALKEFMQYGSFMRFPDKYIFEWKELILVNICKLRALNEIGGHGEAFPFDEFYDVFDYNEETGDSESGEFSQWCKVKAGEDDDDDDDYTRRYNFTAANQFLSEVYNIDDVLPLFSNGTNLVSDYGIQPLEKLAVEIIKQSDPNQIIVTINKILDVTHQRSDLAELFIEGGSKSLDYISNS